MLIGDPLFPLAVALGGGEGDGAREVGPRATYVRRVDGTGRVHAAHLLGVLPRYERLRVWPTVSHPPPPLPSVCMSPPTSATLDEPPPCRKEATCFPCSQLTVRAMPGANGCIGRASFWWRAQRPVVS